jgi:hypothetical protein
VVLGRDRGWLEQIRCALIRSRICDLCGINSTRQFRDYSLHFTKFSCAASCNVRKLDNWAIAGAIVTVALQLPLEEREVAIQVMNRVSQDENDKGIGLAFLARYLSENSRYDVVRDRLRIARNIKWKRRREVCISFIVKTLPLVLIREGAIEIFEDYQRIEYRYDRLPILNSIIDYLPEELISIIPSDDLKRVDHTGIGADSDDLNKHMICSKDSSLYRLQRKTIHKLPKELSTVLNAFDKSQSQLLAEIDSSEAGFPLLEFERRLWCRTLRVLYRNSDNTGEMIGTLAGFAPFIKHLGGIKQSSIRSKR